jgi:hypothetical protein
MEQTNIPNDLADALSKLEATQESSDGMRIAIDSEVTQWLATGLRSEYVQVISSKVEISSENDAWRLAKQVAATCNGAIARQAEFAYLIFDRAEVRIRERLADASSQYHHFDLSVSVESDTIEAAIRNCVNSFLSQPLNVHVVRQQKPNSLEHVTYLRAKPQNPLPTFIGRTAQQAPLEWDLYIWEKSYPETTDGWNVRLATEKNCVDLFIRCLQFAYRDSGRDLELALDSDSKDHEPKIEQELKSQSPSSAKDFVRFLTCQLLSAQSDERAVSALAYSTITEVCRHEHPQIARLLIGLLNDDKKVTLSCLRSLQRFGDRRAYYFLKHNFSYFRNDLDVQNEVLACLAEMSPHPDSLIDIAKLWQECISRDQVKESFDKAITRIYVRHGVPRFRQSARQEFFERVSIFNYAQAMEVLQQSGSAVCLKVTHRLCLHRLLQYGQLCIEAHYEEALRTLKQCKEEWVRRFEKDELRISWFTERGDELAIMLKSLRGDDINTLGSLLDLERASYESELSNLFGRVFALTDVLAKRFAKTAGVRLKGSDKKSYLDQTWVEESLHLVDTGCITEKALRSKLPVNRLLLKTIFQAMARQQAPHQPPETLERVADIIQDLVQISEKRQSSRTGHGTEPITPNTNSMVFDDIWNKLREMFALATGVTPIFGSYRGINGFIKGLLDSCDTEDVSIEDLDTAGYIQAYH